MTAGEKRAKLLSLCEEYKANADRKKELLEVSILAIDEMMDQQQEQIGKIASQLFHCEADIIRFSNGNDLYEIIYNNDDEYDFEVTAIDITTVPSIRPPSIAEQKEAESQGKEEIDENHT